MIPCLGMGSRYCFSCPQLRLITLLKFERHFSGRPGIAGTNYRLSKAALIGVWGQQAEGQPAVPGACSPNLPEGLADANAWSFPGDWLFLCRKMYAPVCFFSTVLCVHVCAQECVCARRHAYAHGCLCFMCWGMHVGLCVCLC